MRRSAPIAGDPFYTSREIQRRMHETGLDKAALGRRIGLTKSGMHRALARPHAAEKHVKTIARVLGCKQADLLEPNVGRAVPQAEPARITPVSPPSSPMVQYFGEDAAAGGAIYLTPGCAVKRLQDPMKRVIGGAEWVLLAPTGKCPDDGSLVLVTKRDGSEWLRLYYRDGNDESLVTLMSSDGSERPLTFKASDIQETRVVIAPLANFQR